MAVEDPLINGFRHDSGSTIFKINGKSYTFLELSYEHKKDPGKVNGNSAQRRGITRGKYEASGTLKLALDEAEQFEQDLQGPLLDTHFEASVAYEEGGRNYYHELVGCLVTSDKTTVSGGSGDAIAYEYALDIALVVKNGRMPIRDGKR